VNEEAAKKMIKANDSLVYMLLRKSLAALSPCERRQNKQK
jgi:hypothetical protein